MSAWNLPPDDNQQMLADSARDYVRRSRAETARAPAGDAPGFSPTAWQAFAGLGWLALPLPEPDGGLGGSLAEICALAEELGRGLVPEPFVANAVQGAMALADFAPPPLRADWLPALAQGHRRVALAAWDPQEDHDDGSGPCTAARTEGRWLLSGTWAMVAGGAGADAYLLPAATQQSGELGIFLVASGTPGLRVRERTLYDGQRVADLQLDQAQAAHALLLGPQQDVSALLQSALDRSMLVAGAETVGMMARAFEITLAYARTRHQFGRAIAANQVLQHRLVDLHVEIEEARALTRAAASAWPGADGSARRRWCAAARSCVAATARHVWQEAVQMHGAIGMTEECEVGPFVKRLALACNLHGGLEAQLERLAAEGLGASTTNGASHGL